MRLARTTAVPAIVAVLLLALYPGAHAGVPTGWSNSPTQGPSPNNSHMVTGNNCQNSDFGNRVSPQGVSLVGQPSPDPNSVTVRMFHPGPGAEIKNETFPASLDGTWSGVFEIPAGLPAGVYPLTARCNGFQFDRTASALVPVVLGGDNCFNCFDYAPDRFYTVIAEADAPDPVEAEVTFTG